MSSSALPPIANPPLVSVTPPPLPPAVSQVARSQLAPSLPAPITASPPGVGTKLSRKQIYKQIDEFILRVKTSKGTSTGFCIGQNLILVPFHVLDLKEVEVISPQTKRYKVSPILCTYRGIQYEAEYDTINMQSASNLDCAIFRIKDPDFPSIPDVQPYMGKLEPGEKVYFGGFPLSQEDPTFHHGTVSSISQKGEISYFTIDGTVLPGNSGGPVFIQLQNSLMLVGVIFSQIADFDCDAQRTMAILKALKGSGLSHSLTIQTDKGPETIHISDTEALGMAYELIQRNLSSGIGKAFHIRHFFDLSAGRPINAVPRSGAEMPVMRGERLPGRLSQNIAYHE